VLLHRYLLEPDNTMVVDHIDHNTLNNTRGNIKIKTVAENAQNRKGANVNSKSGVRGVCWDRFRNKWYAQVWIDGKAVLKKHFYDIKLAELAVVEARGKYHM
jgi:hypothetical protein